jgi:hypothetical protein
MKVLALTLLAGMILASPAFAQRDRDEDLVVLSTTRSVEGMKSLKRVALFLTGDADSETRVLRDALAIALSAVGWVVVDPLEIEAASTRDFQAWLNGIDPQIRQDAEKFEGHLRATWTSEKRFATPNEVALAQLVSANGYLTGTVLFGAHRYQGRLDKTDVSAESEQTVVTNLSFQIVSTAGSEPKTVYEAAIGYRLGGKDILNVAESVRTLVMSARGQQAQK